MATRTGALLAAALSQHEAGRFVEAEALYRQVFAVDPRHPHALHGRSASSPRRPGASTPP